MQYAVIKNLVGVQVFVKRETSADKWAFVCDADQIENKFRKTRMSNAERQKNYRNRLKQNGNAGQGEQKMQALKL